MPRLEPVLVRPGRAVNIFIHGYLAGSTPERRERLRRYIAEAEPAGVSYVLHWRSGNPALPAIGTLGTAAVRTLGNMRPPSVSALLGGGAAYLGVQVAHFKSREREARRIGRQLGELLHVLRRRHGRRAFNLVGHSLGATVIQHALLHADLEGIRLNHCVLLAGAADASPETWAPLVQRMRGGLHNYYSRGDLLLLSTPDLRVRAGRNPIRIDLPAVRNVHRPELGHTDYWPRLTELLPEGMRASSRIPPVFRIPLRRRERKIAA